MKSIIFFIISLFVVSSVFAQNDNSKKDKSEKENVYTVVEEMPKYIGGEDARITFLINNINYPKSAKEAGIQGTVYVTFVINTEGDVVDVKVLRGIGGGCDEEAIRVVSLMPKWIPGRQSGKVVNVQYNMPIKFTLTENEKKKNKKAKQKP